MISVSGLTKSYGGTTVVEDVSFTVSSGSITGFVGPNGAGKTTTMKMMLGLVTPDTGRIEFAGLRYQELEPPATVVGALLDAGHSHPGRSARNHLRCLADLSGIHKGRVDHVLAQVGLAEAADKRVKTFSLGMRQRLGLATALLGNPEVLLLDEPANGLDPSGIRWLRSALVGFADRGGTVFISSHLISELSQYANNLLVIGKGKIVASGTIDDIMATAPEGSTLEDVFLDLTDTHVEFAGMGF